MLADRHGRDIGIEHRGQRMNLYTCQRLFHRIGCRRHQRAVKRCGDSERHGPPGTAFLTEHTGSIHRAFVTGDNDLARRIIVRHNADFAFSRFFANLGCRIEIHAKEHRHGALAHRNRSLHCLSPALEQPCCGCEVKAAGGAQCGIFAQAMARDEIRLVGQRDAAFFFEHAQGRDGIGHDGGLRIFSQRQLVFRPVAHQPTKILSQCIIDFFKSLASDRTRIGKRGAHADGLAALSWKDKSAHLFVPINCVVRLGSAASLCKR